MVINTNRLEVFSELVPRVFINFGCDDGNVELLLFFDVYDLTKLTEKEGIDYINQWMMKFKDDYGFDYFICQMDGAGDGQYYFDNRGKGKLYDELRQ